MACLHFIIAVLWVSAAFVAGSFLWSASSAVAHGHDTLSGKRGGDGFEYSRNESFSHHYPQTGAVGR